MPAYAHAKGAASPSYHPYAKGAARCLVGTMGVAFVGGWLLFPVALLRHTGIAVAVAILRILEGRRVPRAPIIV